jgi:hypothetical protein
MTIAIFKGVRLLRSRDEAGYFMAASQQSQPSSKVNALDVPPPYEFDTTLFDESNGNQSPRFDRPTR